MLKTQTKWLLCPDESRKIMVARRYSRLTGDYFAANPQKAVPITLELLSMA